jgi:hypothetical protein
MTTTNNNEQPTSNYLKQSQTNPILPCQKGVQSQIKPKSCPPQADYPPLCVVDKPNLKRGF